MPNRHNVSRDSLPHIQKRQTLAGSYGKIARDRAFGIIESTEEELVIWQRDFYSMVEISGLRSKIDDLKEATGNPSQREDDIRYLREQIALQRIQNPDFKEGGEALRALEIELDAIAL